MNAVERPVMIMAGGTGGHVFPALAVAERLRALGVPVIWLGTRQGLEARVVPAAGLPIEWLSVGGLRGKGWITKLLAPVHLLRAVFQAARVVLRYRPRSVLGMGGFVAGPGGLTAWLLRRPLLIHEQNAVPGLTNRWLSHLARRILEAFPDTFEASARVMRTGNPVREAIAELPGPEQRMAGRLGPARLLIVGGSLGARALNELVPAALAGFAPAERPEVWHQTGRRGTEDARERYEALGVRARLDPFIEDMAEAYAWADLAVCRAGALTVAELTAVGLGAILVPYPYAVDDHQTHNAEYLVRHGAALLAQQRELDPERLRELLAGLISNRDGLLSLAVAARALARVDAADQVARACLELGANR
jgi:UDP-N-acetylglucosamine--N-acetylmuramyl-(pentapeptide) pyrophosphoryl-undecaprenol N-acetylglucosamine transferase